ncbi:MAG: GspH/FimT family pseudopilin [Arenimonas sp.]|nr:GspH/FimT family pseudopilin [Arenimonas sp.]MBP8097803.1 GspH/FimT family pseudopilin [Arenimonas sp.]
MRRQRGISLIELIVVVVLIAAATALAASVMGAGLPGQQLRNASRELAAQLRYTRAQAIVTGKSQTFSIDARTREWQAPNRRHGQLPQEINLVATGARIEQTRPDIVAIRFFPEGAATGGRIVLSRERAAWQIDVEWLTGEVTVKRAQAPP